MVDLGFIDLLACPACLSPLRPEREGELLRCAGCQRAFSSRRGIPDLIWGKNPPNEGPGDTRAMIQHRVELDRRLVAHSVATGRYLAAAHVHLTPGSAVLDVGTGPGTMLRLIAADAPPDTRLVGFDNSLPALDAAQVALRDVARTGLLRASSRRQFPLRSGAFQVVLRRLAPALPQEILRVLVPGGALIHFTYGPRHWREVYDALPELPRPRQTDVSAATAEDELRGQGFADATAHLFEESADVSIDDVLLTLQGNPAAHFLQPQQALALLANLSATQGQTGMLRLTSHYVVRVATAPR